MLTQEEWIRPFLFFMMKTVHTILLLTIILVITACSQAPDLQGQKLRFGKMQCILLDDGESYVQYAEVQADVDSLYAGLQSCGKIQYPLNRIIKGSNYYVFVSLSTVDDLHSNAESLAICFESNIKDSRNEENSYYFLMDNNGIWTSMKLFTNEGMTFAIHYCTGNEQAARKIFDNPEYYDQKLDCTFN